MININAAARWLPDWQYVGDQKSFSISSKISLNIKYLKYIFEIYSVILPRILPMHSESIQSNITFSLKGTLDGSDRVNNVCQIFPRKNLLENSIQLGVMGVIIYSQGGIDHAAVPTAPPFATVVGEEFVEEPVIGA